MTAVAALLCLNRGCWWLGLYSVSCSFRKEPVLFCGTDLAQLLSLIVPLWARLFQKAKLEA